MKQKPSMSDPNKPVRITLPEHLQHEFVEVWRKGNFMVWFHTEEQGGVIVDLLPRTLVRHVGEIGEIFAIADALQNLRVKGAKLYPETYYDMTDEEFLDAGMAALMEMDDVEPEMPDISAEEAEELLRVLKNSFLDDLLKPPKKD